MDTSIEITSILEDVTKDIQDVPDITLDKAKTIVRDKVIASGIKEESKQEIYKNLDDERFTHVHPTSMRDRGSLLTYLFNSILKYKGLGVIK